MAIYGNVPLHTQSKWALRAVQVECANAETEEIKKTSQRNIDNPHYREGEKDM